MKAKLRVLTFNIRKGLGASGRSSQLAELKLVLKETKAHLVFLQEVMGESQKDVHLKAGLPKDQLEYLADSVWPHSAYGQNSVHDEGHHGNAILSQFPILQSENLNISTNSFERRGLLHALVQIPNFREPLDLICLHLNLLEGGRNKQLKHLIQRVRENVRINGPMLIAGDFNDWRGAASKQLQEELSVLEASLNHHGQHQLTFPAWWPILPLDRIYFRGLTLLGVDRLDHHSSSRISDHQAIWAEFELPKDSP